MATTATAALPEQGQLVQVRSRQWIVNDVRTSTLPDPALKPAFSGPQNLITLSSVEDDGLGEELQVVWEIEPGARVIEKAALPNPTGFDAPDKLDAFLDALSPGRFAFARPLGIERSAVKPLSGPARIARGRKNIGCLTASSVSA